MKDAKIFLTLPLLLAILVCGAVIASGCIQMPQQTAQAGQPAGPSPDSGSCAVGSWVRTGNFEYRITGVETHSIAGKTMQMCCMEKIANGQKSKVCNGMGSEMYSIVWLTDEETGGLYKAAEIYEQGDKTCNIGYDPSGEKISEMCV